MHSLPSETEIHVITVQDINANVITVKLNAEFYTPVIITVIIACTLQPLYNMIHYNTFLDTTQFKERSQKFIDYHYIIFQYNL